MGTSDYNVASSALQDVHAERERTRSTAERYRCPFVDLNEVRIDPELFRSIPAELMFRFNFVPLEAHENQLIVAVADPSHVLLSDELPLLLGKKLVLKVATPTQISDLLKRTEQSQRVRDKGRFVDFRVSIMPSIHGEDAVLRVLDKETLSEKFHNLSLEVVGFSDEELRKFRRYIREPYGMVLVTGPTGSGKTTTLYAAINEIKTDEDKIITIEDPVEYQVRGITQIPVNEKKGLTFARGLRSILRHDPDKIMVGEIRDQETAQ